MSDATFDRIVAEFGELLGIAGLAPSEAGFCQLVFDERHVVQLLHVGGRGCVLLSCMLGPERTNAAQAELMARSNFLQAGGGAIVCQAPDGRTCIQLGIPLVECRPYRLEAALEALLNQAEAWEARLHEAPSQGLQNPRNPALWLPV